MRWELDWLARTLTVPYVPTLGPVHPAVCTPALFDAVSAAAEPRQLLPYDPARSWSHEKDEHLLPDQVHQTPEQILVPTLRRHPRRTVTLYCYRRTPPDITALSETAAALRSAHDASAARIVWFARTPPDHHPDVRRTRVLLKEFTPVDATASTSSAAAVTDLDTCPADVRTTFAAFAATVAAEGFEFLYHRWRDATAGGPILVAIAEQQIVGAIGPMRLLPDPAGVPRLLPQYLAVLPSRRRRGTGRALWQAAVAWAHRHDAGYQLLQTVVDGASDRMFLSAGLIPLGCVCQTTLPDQ